MTVPTVETPVRFSGSPDHFGDRVIVCVPITLGPRGASHGSYMVLCNDKLSEGGASSGATRKLAGQFNSECLMQKGLEEVFGLAKGFELSSAEALVSLNTTCKFLLQ